MTAVLRYRSGAAFYWLDKLQYLMNPSRAPSEPCRIAAECCFIARRPGRKWDLFMIRKNLRPAHRRLAPALLERLEASGPEILLA
jgi:hypothetical protein